MKILKSCAVAFSVRALNALSGEVYAHTKFGGMLLRICGEKMSMAAAYFPDEGRVSWKDLGEPVAEFATAGLHQRNILGGAGGVFHGMLRSMVSFSAPARLDNDH